MQSMTHSRIAAIGVAALLSTSCLVAADTPTLTSTWDAATTSKNDDVTIKIAGKIQAVAFGYANGRGDVDNAKKLFSAKDGVGLEDAEITFSGTAYKHVTFGMRYDIGNSADLNNPSNPSTGTVASDKNYIKLDKWWVGLTAVPYLGEITIREVDEHMGFILSESWLEETMVHNAFYGNGFRPMVGVKWAKTISNTGIAAIDDRVKLWAATGLIANEIGATDKDWSLNASVCWDAVKQTDNTNVSLKFDYARENMATTAGEAYKATAFMYAGKTSKPVLGTFESDKADDVSIFCPAISATYRNIGVIGEYYLVDGNAHKGGKNFQISGYTLAAAVALTGENEMGCLGVKKPNKVLKGDSLLENFGAIELVARLSMLDASDTDYKGSTGLDATECQVGVNWYPTGNMLVGLMYAFNTWEANEANARTYDLSMFGLRTMVKF